MTTTYNRIAGQSLERLAALSDGIFAVAMTLLVLDIHAPSMETIHSEQDLSHALSALLPRVVMYLMSFMTLGIFWTGQQTQFNALARSSRDLSWIHIVFLAAVSITPFSTSLLAEFITFRTALLIYWVNITDSGHRALCQLALCATIRLIERRDQQRTRLRGGTPHFDRPSALRFRRLAMRFEYLLEHRLHCPRAIDLRDCAEDPPALKDVAGASGHRHRTDRFRSTNYGSRPLTRNVTR